MKHIEIIKRDGSIEQFDADKLNKWAEWASDKAKEISWSSIVLSAMRGVTGRISTTDLQQKLITACLNYRTPAYLKMAARLLLGDIYKEVYNDIKPLPLPEFYNKMVSEGKWADMGYSQETLQYLEDFVIDHSLDTTYSYTTLKQLSDKYGIRTHNQLHESPQMVFMGIAMHNMRNEDSIDSIIEAYRGLASFKINLPTPTLTNERSVDKLGPSCCVISGKDTAESLMAVSNIAYTMTTTNAGIGLEVVTRAPKEPVKGGKIEHGGKHPYYDLYSRSVKAARQQVRGGSATVSFNALDPEILDLLTLRQMRTEPTYRLDTLDYSLQVNSLFIQKVIQNEEWLTVSEFFAPKLWELSYSGNNEAFEAEYNRLSESPPPQAKMVPARDIFAGWVKARGDHGRLYLSFLDNLNRYTPFEEPIRLSNLCQEIALPTKPFEGPEDLYNREAEGEVALCNLAALVVTNLKTDEEYEEAAYTTAKIIDNTIDNMRYPFPAVERTAKARRSIGVGITDLAHHMASKGLAYDTYEGRTEIHRVAERHLYFMLKASSRLAKERGACEFYSRTKYSKGWLPIDDNPTRLDKLCDTELQFDWEGLRNEIASTGLRFSSETAIMPNESSSLLTNTTNSIYPVRLTSVWKSSPKGMVYFEAPNHDKYNYQIAYDVDHLDMVRVYSIIQRFTTQGISADFYTQMLGTEGSKLSMANMLRRVVLANHLGMKTFYYENFQTDTPEEEPTETVNCVGGCAL